MNGTALRNARLLALHRLQGDQVQPGGSGGGQALLLPGLIPDGPGVVDAAGLRVAEAAGSGGGGGGGECFIVHVANIDCTPA